MSRLIAAALILFGSGGVVWAQGAATISAPKDIAKAASAQIGDYWHYDSRDDITGHVVQIDYIVTDVTPTTVAVRAQVEGRAGPPGSMTYDSAWSVIRRDPWRFLPSDGTGILQRLVVGASWSFEGDSINLANHRSRRRSLTSKIIGREALTTKAGTFDTYRIETSWSARDTWDPTLRFEYTQTTWYVPQVNHWVKRTYTFRTDGLVRERSTVTLTAWGHAQK
ncbi:MAG: hypothetical protein AB1508_02945 [Pseudomonadota bacterium]